MYVALAVCCLAVFFSWLASIRRFRYGLFVSFFILGIFSALRYDFGTDYLTYIADFEYNESITFSTIIFDLEFTKEQGWAFFMKCFSPLGYIVFFGLLSVFICNTYYRLIKRYVPREYYWFATSIYVFNFNLFILQQSMIGQSFVMAICVNIFMKIDKLCTKNESVSTCSISKQSQIVVYGQSKKLQNTLPQRNINLDQILPIIGLLFVITTLHMSSVVMIPFLLLCFLPMQNDKLLGITMGILVIIAWVSSSFTQSLFQQFMVINVVSEYSDKYLMEDGMKFGIRRVFEYFPFILSIFYLCNDKIIEKRRQLIFMSMVSFVILPFSSIMLLIARLAYYFDIFSIAAFPLVYQNIKIGFIRKCLIGLMLAINIYMWFYLITNDEWDGKFLEYRTFFSIL